MSLSVRENAALSALGRFARPASARAATRELDGVPRSLSIPRRCERRRWRRRSRRCRAATSRRWSSPGRCCPSRRSCSPTSPPRASTSAPAPRSTGSCASVARRGRPGRRRLLRRQGARRALRPGPGDVARPRRRDADGRRGHRGADRRGRGQLHHRGRSRRPHGSGARRAPARLRRFLQRRLRALGPPARRDGRLLGRVHRPRRTTGTCPPSTSRTCSPRPPRSGFIALGQNIALLTGGIDLSVGPLAGLPRRRRLLLRQRRQVRRRRCSLGLVADGRGRGRRRARSTAR